MANQREIQNIFLVGFMGTGKTSVGKLLSKKLHWVYIDTDTLIEKETGKSIPEIFASQGEPDFRDLESITLKKILSRKKQIISTGGGIVLRQENIRLMKENGIILCLTASPQIILKRIIPERTNRGPSHRPNRPVLGENPTLEKIKEILHQRSPFYAQADLTVDTGSGTKKEIIDKIVSDLNLLPKRLNRGSEI